MNASVDKSTIRVGDRVTYTLIIDRAEDLEIHDPGKGTNLGAFEVKDYVVYDPETKDNRIVEKFDYIISVYDTGKYVIPPFPIAFKTADSSAKYQFISSEPLEIYARSIVNDPNADIKDIRSPFIEPTDYVRLALIWSAVIILLLALWFGWRWYKKRKASQPVFKKEMIRPAHEIALEALDALEAQNLIEAGKEKVFFTAASDILRQYIENRFYIKAMEETTSEIFHSLKEGNVAEAQVEFAHKALNNCDLVKFAKYLPGQKGADATLRLMKKFITETQMEFEAVENETAELATETEKAES